MRPCRRGPARWLLITLLPLVVGCVETPEVSVDQPGISPSAVAPQGGAASTPALARQKQAAGIEACPASDRDVAVVDRGLPDVTLPCLGGGPDVRLAGLRGTPTVINVWAQWCPPCRREAPFLATTADDAGDRVRFLGIDHDDPEPAAAIDFAHVAGWRYPQLYDRDKRTTEALRTTPAPPQTFFVDADGRLTYSHVGPFTSTAELRTAIADHLGVRL